MRNTGYARGARALRDALSRSEKTQVAVEREIGAGQGCVSHWTSGKRRPGGHAMLALHRVLGVDPLVWETAEERWRRVHEPTSTPADAAKRGAA